MRDAHPTEAELSQFALHGLRICDHLRACDVCRTSLFTLPLIRASADTLDPDPPWRLTIDGETTTAADSDAAAPLIADAWRAGKSIQCATDTDAPAAWSDMLGLAARVNRILEAEGWKDEWWVP